MDAIDKSGPATKRSRTLKEDHLDKALKTWFDQQRDMGVPISGPLLKEQAKKMNNMMEP